MACPAQPVARTRVIGLHRDQSGIQRRSFLETSGGQAGVGISGPFRQARCVEPGRDLAHTPGDRELVGAIGAQATRAGTRAEADLHADLVDTAVAVGVGQPPGLVVERTAHAQRPIVGAERELDALVPEERAGRERRALRCAGTNARVQAGAPGRCEGMRPSRRAKERARVDFGRVEPRSDGVRHRKSHFDFREDLPIQAEIHAEARAHRIRLRLRLQCERGAVAQARSERVCRPQMHDIPTDCLRQCVPTRVGQAERGTSEQRRRHREPRQTRGRSAARSSPHRAALDACQTRRVDEQRRARIHRHHGSGAEGGSEAETGRSNCLCCDDDGHTP